MHWLEDERGGYEVVDDPRGVITEEAPIADDARVYTVDGRSFGGELGYGGTGGYYPGGNDSPFNPDRHSPFYDPQDVQDQYSRVGWLRGDNGASSSGWSV